MPKLYEMTWVKESRRWLKKYKGKIYSVSCRQLGAPPTKEGSRDKANAWWLQKQAELDGISASATESVADLDATSQLVGKTLQQSAPSVQDLRRLVGQGEAAGRLLAILEKASVYNSSPEQLNNCAPADQEAITELLDLTEGKVVGAGNLPNPTKSLAELAQGQGLPLEVISEVLTNGLETDADHEWLQQELEQLSNKLDRTNPDIDPDKTVGGQIKAWIESHRSRHIAGNLSSGRFDAYARNIRVFEDWIKPSTEIEAINAFTLERYFQFLANKINCGDYSASYCRNLFGAMKNFVCRLAELGLIPMPGNIRSRNLHFDDHTEEIQVFSVQEVRELLDAASERTKLFLLLMLNCGMYQNDIAELKDSEVDWENATITRKRSKRKKKGFKVTYKLWKMTFQLLKKYRSGKSTVLLSENGNPLVVYEVNGNDLRRYDIIHGSYQRLRKKIGQSKSIKVFRKTAASLLETHDVYGRYVHYFLAHAPRTLADKHYVVPDEKQFFEALDWLRDNLGLDQLQQS